MPDIDLAIRNLLIALTGSADGSTTADGFFAGGPLFTMLGVIATLAGWYFIARGVMLFRAFGQHITMASRSGELGGPITFIIIGVLMINIENLADTGLLTLYGSSEAAKWSNDYLSWAGNTTEQFENLSMLIYWYLKFIGGIAFLRGWFILAKMGHPGAQPGSVGKGVTHVVGGLLLMNILDTAKMLAQTFGFST